MRGLFRVQRALHNETLLYRQQKEYFMYGVLILKRNDLHVR